MLTEIGAKQLAIIFKMKPATFHLYLSTHRKELSELATKGTRNNGKTFNRRNYNSKQLEYIVYKIFGDTPQGYKFEDGNLIETKSD
jgi:hypothetical protein